jgi:hypothetical protein
MGIDMNPAPTDVTMDEHDDEDDEDATVPVRIGENGPILCPICKRPLEDPTGTGILMCPKCGSKPSRI